MFRAYRIVPRCRSQAMLHRGDCAAIKSKGYGLKIVATKAATAATVPTPLLTTLSMIHYDACSMVCNFAYQEYQHTL